MRCGISTACFYPTETKKALELVAASGAKVTEVFLNTFSELEDSYIDGLLQIAETAGLEIVSIHPFSSAMEGFFFATHYKSRMEDGLALYKRFFRAAGRLGATKMVFHGDHAPNGQHYSMQQYAKNFAMLCEIGDAYGVTLCHENVSYCRLGDPDAVREITPLLGDRAAFVLDTKQARRFGTTVQEMLAAMGEHVRHVHISDYSDEENCLPPGQGQFDFALFINALGRMGYTGDFMIELYRDGFTQTSELVDAMRYIQALLPEKV